MGTAATAVTLKCLICNSPIAITNLTEVQNCTRTFQGYKCPRCRQILPFRISNIKLTHTAGLVGGEVYVNHALAKGVITSSAA